MSFNLVAQFWLAQLLSLVFLLNSVETKAQNIPMPIDEVERLTHSYNGWQITAHGTIKVLLLFVEIDYDVNPSKNPLPDGTTYWPVGQLPVYADDVFDAEVLKVPKATMTRYYNDCSLGDLRVIGDYWVESIVLKESDIGNLSLSTIKKAIGKHIDGYGALLTRHNSTVESFDLWKRTRKVGTPREAGPDDPIAFDHVMMMVRNFHGLPRDNGSAGGGTFGKILGYDSDSYSQFGAGADLPQRILRHEFNHLLLGANNFHCCGGSSSAFVSYFLTTQFGWGLMGAANSSFDICNAWDRDRLNWRGKGKEHTISCASPTDGKEVFSDLVPENAQHQGRYLLRDFVSTGDALRIRIPFIDAEQYPQYLWVENHQTSAFNGSQFDEFGYAKQPGMTPATPGLYMFMQIGRTEKSGLKTFGGDADYLRFMPADGMYDLIWTGDSVLQKWQSKPSPISAKPPGMQNPLSGIQDLETIPHNRDPNDKELDAGDAVGMWAERGRDGALYHNPKFGHARHAFTKRGNPGVSVGTNPSSASMLTHTTGQNISRRMDVRNNRAVLLNGISVKILEERSDGSVLVDVRFNNTLIENNIRWCADSIILNPIADAEFDLELAAKKQLMLDHGRSPTRNVDPVLRRNEWVFVSPTKLHVTNGAKVKLNKKSVVTIDNGSSLHFYSGSVLKLEPKAAIRLKNKATLIIEKGATFSGSKTQIKACKDCKVVFAD